MWKANNILPYQYKYSDKINRSCSKYDWFLMILAKFYQKISPKMQNFGLSGPNCVFLPITYSKFAPKSIHQIARFQLQKCKIFQLLRAVRTSAQLVLSHHQIIPPNVEDGSTPLLPDQCQMCVKLSRWHYYTLDYVFNIFLEELYCILLREYRTEDITTQARRGSVSSSLSPAISCNLWHQIKLRWVTWLTPWIFHEMKICF